jgi:hypothetical protein
MKPFIVVMLICSAFALTCTKSTEPDNSAPYEPGSPSPAQGATDQPLQVVLQWSGGDPDSDPVHYDVYFGASSPPPLVSSNQTGRNYTPNVLDYTTQYYWRIVAEDDHDHSTESNTWHFTTGETPPTPTSVSIRADGEGDGVVIRWDAMSNIDGFSLETPDSTVTLNGDDTTYTDDAPSQTGTYTLYSMHGTTMSSPATVTSTPISSPSDVTVYTMDGPGGYGWDINTGEGEAYFLDGGHTSVVDFYLAEDTVTIYLRSCDQPPYNGDKTTDILDTGTTSFFIAPSAGYGTDAPVVTGDYYAMRVQGGYYAKVFMTSSDSTSATFNCWFQVVQSLRIF